MELIYFLGVMGFIAILWFIGLMWYDRKHNYDW